MLRGASLPPAPALRQTPRCRRYRNTSPSGSRGSGLAATCAFRASFPATLPWYLLLFSFFSIARICGQVRGGAGRMFSK